MAHTEKIRQEIADIAKEMKELSRCTDIEATHYEADSLLKQVVIALTRNTCYIEADELIGHFDDLEKWYA